MINGVLEPDIDAAYKEYVDSILRVSLLKNKALYDQIKKENKAMYDVLREYMKEDFEKAEARGKREGKAEGKAEGEQQRL